MRIALIFIEEGIAKSDGISSKRGKALRLRRMKVS